MNINTEKIHRPENATITKVALVLILFIFLFSIESKTNAKAIPFSKVRKNLKKNTNVTMMHNCNKRELKKYMNIDNTLYSDFIYYRSTKALSVDEVLILKLSKPEYQTQVTDLIESRIEAQIKIFENYGPKQVSLLNNAIIKKHGNCILYCVSSKPDQYEEVFKNAF